MAGNETAVHAAGSTSSGARARSGARRRRRRPRVRRVEEPRKREVRRRAVTSVLASDLLKRNMAAGCCGAKKQRLGGGGGGGGGATSSLSSCDSTVIRHGVPRKPMTIAQPEMGFFCFDVLYCQLHQLDPPKTPNFSNEPLWVAFARHLFSSLSFPHSQHSLACPSVSLARRVSCCLRSSPVTRRTSSPSRPCARALCLARISAIEIKIL